MNETDTNFQRFCSQCGGLVDADARFCKHCAFDLTKPARHSDEKVVTAKSQQHSNSKTTLAIIGVAIVGLLILGLVGMYLYKRNRTRSDVAATSPTPAPTPTMSDRAKQVEDKILRGETLSDSDIAGLAAYELRVLRNVHFARYGRKYDSGGLGDYFNSRSWYKPSDSYNEIMITSNDKANINLISAAEKSINNSGVTSAANTATSSNSVPEGTPSSMPEMDDKPSRDRIRSDCRELVSGTIGQAYIIGRGLITSGRYMDFVDADVQGVSLEGTTAQAMVLVTIRYNSIFAETTRFYGTLAGCVPVSDINSKERMLNQSRRFSLKMLYRKYDTGWRLENWSGCR